MPGKPSRPCRIPGCPNLQPCSTEDHEPKPWQGSTRSDKVASGWQQQRDNQRILKRHQWTCHICGQLGAFVVDHVIPLAEGGANTDENKRPAHAVPCHRDKTSAEATRARKRRRA